MNSSGTPCRIDENTFDQINPKVITIVIDDVAEIVSRLQARDGKFYDVEILKKLQQMEIEYAKDLSSKYSIPYIEIKMEIIRNY